MKLQSPKKILKDDFSQDDKEMAGILGGVINNFQEEVYNLSAKNITISDNLNQEIKTLKVTTVSGIPDSKISFKNNLKGKVQGTNIIRTFGNSSVTSAPFIEFSEVSGIITINKVVGLVDSVEYQLVILIIGS